MTPIEAPDSVTISYKHLVASRLAFADIKTFRKVLGLQQQRLHEKDAVIQFTERALKECKSTDSLNNKKIQNLEKQSGIYETKFLNADYQRKQEKGAKIGLAVTTPVVAVLCFILGFYLHK